MTSNRVGREESKAAVLSLMMVLLGDEEGICTHSLPMFLRSFLLYFLPSFLPSLLPSFLSFFHLSILPFFLAFLLAWLLTFEKPTSAELNKMWVKMYCWVDFLSYVFFFAVIGKKEPSSSTSLIVGLCLGVLALVTCVVIGLLRYRRSRRAIEVNLSDIYMTYRCHTNVSTHYWWPYLKIIFTWACLAARLRRPWKLGIRIVTCQSAKHPCEESLGKINAKDVTWVQRHNPLSLYPKHKTLQQMK